MLVLTLTYLYILFYLPLRTLGASSFVIINVSVTYLCYSLVVVMLGASLLNLLGLPVAPGLGLYYAALLTGRFIQP